ncbi:MAG: hypothetical protein OQK67_09520 [Chlorobium sp.]|nr:hypothetical protein [Chlorobium sp.]MCW8814885.1 hypothetical protein [Chlorobium sp.]MCW8818776.1 hypothetical protein [Ignavibacteriaceae bacterium]
MASPEKHHIVRRLLRFFEISLFFVISVLGYGFLAKTSSFNAKSKSNENASRQFTSGGFYENNSSLLYSYSLAKPESSVRSTPPSSPYYAVLRKKAGIYSPYSFIPRFLTHARFHSSNERLFLLNQAFII